MKKVISLVALILILITSVLSFASCAKSNIIVDISKENIGVDISQDLYGLFIEDISYACDGGLVSNLIANTSFDYKAAPLTNWTINDLDYKVDN